MADKEGDLASLVLAGAAVAGLLVVVSFVITTADYSAAVANVEDPGELASVHAAQTRNFMTIVLGSIVPFVVGLTYYVLRVRWNRGDDE